LPDTKGGVGAAADYHLGIEIKNHVLNGILMAFEGVLKLVGCIVEELDDPLIRCNC
jgi:hypothetical protein